MEQRPMPVSLLLFRILQVKGLYPAPPLQVRGERRSEGRGRGEGREQVGERDREGGKITRCK